MSNTIAHRLHVQHHVPLMPVLAVIVTARPATVVTWAVNQPAQTTTTPPVGERCLHAGHPAGGRRRPGEPGVPPLAHEGQCGKGGYPRASIVGRYHMVEGATLDPVSTNPYDTASYKAPHYPR